jgi:hypothetical protein
VVLWVLMVISCGLEPRWVDFGRRWAALAG